MVSRRSSFPQPLQSIFNRNYSTSGSDDLDDGVEDLGCLMPALIALLMLAMMIAMPIKRIAVTLESDDANSWTCEDSAAAAYK